MRLFIYSKSILTSVLMHSNISPLLQVDHKTLNHKTLKELCFLYQSIDLKYKTCHIRVTCQIAWLQLMQWILLHVSWSIPVCDFIYFCHNLFDNAVTFIKLCLVASQCPVLFTLLSLSFCVFMWLFTCLWVYLFARFCKNYSTDFHQTVGGRVTIKYWSRCKVCVGSSIYIFKSN